MDQTQAKERIKFIRVKGIANKFIYKRGDVYWVRARKSGFRDLQESLATSSLAEARELRDAKVAVWLGKKPKHQGIKLVGTLFLEFLDTKKNKRANTVYSMKNSWEQHLSEFFGKMSIDEITEGSWSNYVSWKRKQPGCADRKFFNDRKWLSMFMGWAHRNGIAEILPKFEDVDPEITVGKVYTLEETRCLLENAGEDLQLQIMCALTMGMRKSEILTLEWTQIDFARGSIYLPPEKTKIGKGRTFPMNEWCSKILGARKLESVSKWVFPSPKDLNKPVGPSGNKSAWETCRKNAKVSGRFHDLRHTFLTMAFKKSPYAAQICHYAGLSLEQAQKTYLHFDLEDIREVSGLIMIEPQKLTRPNAV